MKKIFVVLSTILIILILLVQQSYAQAIDTGNATGFSSVANCANLTGTTCNSLTQLEPNPTTTPPPGGSWGSALGTGGGEGGPSSYSCGDTKPNAVTNLSAVVGPGEGQVTLSWLPPTGAPYSHFLVSFSDNSTTQKWGSPDIGSGTSFTVSGLGSGTYYFWIAAVNGCMPGDLIGPVTAGTTVAVLGASTIEEATPTPTIEKTVKAAEQIVSAVCETCIWWPFLALEIIALALYGYLAAKRLSLKKLWVAQLSIPVLTYILFLLFNGSCVAWVVFINSASIFCTYFWLLDLGVYILYMLEMSKTVKRFFAKTFGGK